MPGIRINKQRILNRIQPHFDAIADEFGEQLQSSFDDEVWDWPRETIRKSGEVAGSPRDIHDRGDLQRSQTQTTISRFRVRYRWGVPYAAIVLTGYQTRSGLRVEGRNWIEYTVRNKYNPKRALRRRIK